MLKPGGNVDSWCGKRKLILAHTIEVMAGDKPARVHCNTCKAQHSYKPYEPGEARGQVRKRDCPQAQRPKASRTDLQNKVGNEPRNSSFLLRCVILLAQEVYGN
jgi:hypothetical protein